MSCPLQSCVRSLLGHLEIIERLLEHLEIIARPLPWCEYSEGDDVEKLVHLGDYLPIQCGNLLWRSLERPAAES